MAANPSFYIEGLDKLLRALEKLDEAASQNLRDAGFKAGKIISDKAKTIVPTRSGSLQDSIRPVKTARGAKVRAGGTRVPYAGVIHFGWHERNIADNPFLYRAVDSKVDEAVQFYMDEVLKIWDRNI